MFIRLERGFCIISYVTRSVIENRDAFQTSYVQSWLILSAGCSLRRRWGSLRLRPKLDALVSSSQWSITPTLGAGRWLLPPPSPPPPPLLLLRHSALCSSLPHCCFISASECMKKHRASDTPVSWENTDSSPLERIRKAHEFSCSPCPRLQGEQVSDGSWLSFTFRWEPLKPWLVTVGGQVGGGGMGWAECSRDEAGSWKNDLLCLRTDPESGGL